MGLYLDTDGRMMTSAVKMWTAPGHQPAGVGSWGPTQGGPAGLRHPRATQPGSLSLLPSWPPLSFSHPPTAAQVAVPLSPGSPQTSPLSPCDHLSSSCPISPFSPVPSQPALPTLLIFSPLRLLPIKPQTCFSVVILPLPEPQEVSRPVGQHCCPISACQFVVTL